MQQQDQNRPGTTGRRLVFSANLGDCQRCSSPKCGSGSVTTGMRAILLYYMYFSVTKGGLGFDQSLSRFYHGNQVTCLFNISDWWVCQ